MNKKGGNYLNFSDSLIVIKFNIQYSHYLNNSYLKFPNARVTKTYDPISS